MHSTNSNRSKLSLRRKKGKDTSSASSSSNSKVQTNQRQATDLDGAAIPEQNNSQVDISSHSQVTSCSQLTQSVSKSKLSADTGARFSLVLKKVDVSLTAHKHASLNTQDCADSQLQKPHTSTQMPLSKDKVERYIEDDQLDKEKSVCHKCNKILSDLSRRQEHQDNCSGLEKDLPAKAGQHPMAEPQGLSELDDLVNTSRDDSDFKHPFPPPILKRKRKKKDLQETYLQSIEEEQLQLALALSASVDPVHTAVDGPLEPIAVDDKPSGSKRAKKAKRTKAVEAVPPLLTVTSQQTRDMLAIRAEEMLKGSAFDGDEIQCTPAFGTSDLASSNQTHLLVQDAPKSLPDDHILFLSNGEELVHTEPCSPTILPSLAKVVPGFESVEGFEPTTWNDLGNGVTSNSNIVEENSPAVIVQTGEDKYDLFASNLQYLDYPTLWELTCHEKSDDRTFYVPALESVVSPVKAMKEPSLDVPSEVVSQITNSVAGGCVPFPVTTTIEALPSSKAKPQPPSVYSQEGAGISKLCSDLRALLCSPVFSDVEISTNDGTVVSAHAVLLAARCPSLKARLTSASSRPIRLDLTDYEENVVVSFLEFAYTGSLPPVVLSDQSLRQSLALFAREWSIEELVLLCRPETETNSDSQTALGMSSLDTGFNLNQAVHSESVATMPTSLGTAPKLVSPAKGHTEVENQSEVKPLPATLNTQTDTGGHTGLAEPREENSTSLGLILISESPELVDEHELVDLSQSSNSSKANYSPHVSGNLPLLGESPEQATSPNTLLHESVLISESPEFAAANELVDLSQSSDNTSPKGDTSLHNPEFSLPPCSPEEATDPTCTQLPCKTDAITVEVSRTVESNGSTSSSPQSHVSLSSSVLIGASEQRANTSQVAELSHHTGTDQVGHSSRSSSDELFDLSSSQINDRRDTSVDTLSLRLLAHDIDESGSFVSLPQASKDSVVEISELSMEPATIALVDTMKPRLPESPELLATQQDDGFEAETLTGGADMCEMLLDSPTMFEDFTTPLRIEPAAVDSHSEANPTFKTPRELRSMAKIGSQACTSHTSAFKTPHGVGRLQLETDDDITPLPNYRDMVTPVLKEKCGKFGLKPLPKRKMIAKLEEIYEYTHPLVDANGDIIEQLPPSKTATKEPTGRKKTTKKATASSTQSEENCEETSPDLKSRIRASICSNRELYQDVLMYKPLELSVIHSKLKASGLSVSKDKLRDILDHWCVTFTIPRHIDPQRTTATSATQHPERRTDQ